MVTQSHAACVFFFSLLKFHLDNWLVLCEYNQPFVPTSFNLNFPVVRHVVNSRPYPLLSLKPYRFVYQCTAFNPRVAGFVTVAEPRQSRLTPRFVITNPLNVTAWVLASFPSIC